MRWKQLWRRLRGGHLTRRRAAGSVAAGLFIGSLPLYGLHFPLCVAVCVPLSLDLVTAYVAANVSNPFLAPFLIAGEVQIGALILEGHFVPFSIEQARAAGVGGFVAQAAVGSVVVGAGLALVGALLALLVVKRDALPPDDDLDQAIDRTVSRYARASRGDRIYVATKLHTDPVVRQLAGISGGFGEVLDVATGRGQLALVLVELGLARCFTGLDWDARKIAVCQAAAGPDGVARVADVTEAELPPSDTVLLIDVLHYLPLEQQHALLERAAAAVRPGGRLLIRELDPRSRIGLWAERIGARLGVNRGVIADRRAATDLMDALVGLGLLPRLVPHPDGRSSPNYLVLGER
ncbi:MAG: DUF2062 domain-containing protein [Myxococcales bacterium]|nr:DUF2062 domain-containing protein [Myxococcales bacterium]